MVVSIIGGAKALVFQLEIAGGRLESAHWPFDSQSPGGITTLEMSRTNDWPTCNLTDMKHGRIEALSAAAK